MGIYLPRPKAPSLRELAAQLTEGVPFYRIIYMEESFVKKDWRNLSWKDLNNQEKMAFIVLCVLTAWMVVMALFYKLWSIPDWAGYLWMIAAAAALYWFRRMAKARLSDGADEEDEETDEESTDE